MSFWEQMRSSIINLPIPAHNRSQYLQKILLYFTICCSITYFVYSLKLVSKFHPNYDYLCSTISNPSWPNSNSTAVVIEPTSLTHIVFGIAASSSLWNRRKEYIKIWYKSESGMRGVVWLDKNVSMNNSSEIPMMNDHNLLPPVRISETTDSFPYTNRQGHRSAIRISRIITETLRMEMREVRWFVMGDDDTIFIPENLVRVLSKYDHNEYYYIGSSSESHLQNIHFSYSMAYGGGGFAISYPLAVALGQMQDRCIQRYPGLYGSDDRMHACMAELGIPLTKEIGFHQYDVYGNLFGLLAAHPVTPFVSMHHIDIVEPIFPDVNRVEGLQRLQIPMRIDSAGLMQQSICYDRARMWTVSVSWGFVVQVVRGIISPREMEMPTRTFLNWYRRADYTSYSFNTRALARNPCQKPFVFYLTEASEIEGTNKTLTEYTRHQIPHPLCTWRMEDPSLLQTVLVFKTPNPQLWDRSPRRNCCRVLSTRKKENMAIDVGLCKPGEVSEV